MTEATVDAAPGMSDAELTARIRGLLADSVGASSVHAVRPEPATVVIDAHTISNFLPVLAPASRRQLVAAIRAWLPEVEVVRFDPHH
ncbi:MAG TPA: hypothetical protein VNN74_04985 [Candidatus Micrarchaeia archaeon]|nr:hypothetical protein [Candidatus Micrarchaeia archaeon]